MINEESSGHLIVIGGAEDKKGECVILKEFIRLSHKAKARIVVMTVATDYPEEAGAEYKEVFKRLGAGDVQVIDVSQRKDAQSETAITSVEEASGVFFTGGDQLHVTSLLGGTKMHETLRRRHLEGITIGGTSAGAAMMSNTMIIRGEADANPRFGGIDIATGMNFLQDTVIDTHFSQRGRIGRLITAVSHYPQDIGFGIDENTAMIVSNGVCEVIGENSITVVDAGAITYTNLPELERNDNLTLHNLVIHVATTRNIPWFRIGENSLVQLGYGKKRTHIQAGMSDRTSAIAVEIAGDKEFTKSILEQASIPVPNGEIVQNEEDAIKALSEIGVPCVVKPLDGRQGLGVSLNISTPEQMKHAFEAAHEYSRNVLVEELLVGRNYRVLVIGGRMIAASERLPAHVIGDGSHSIAELIEIANRDSRRGEGHEKPLTQIKVDAILHAYLEKTGKSLQDVPANTVTVFLRESINLSTGGTAKDVTDIVHPDIAAMCERAARVIEMDICGVDLVLKDIAAPLEKDSGGIIEINAAPGLRMHIYPGEGTPRDVGGAIMEMLYPEENDGRIPIFSITGTNGKTTVTRMIGHVLAKAGQLVGMTTTDGIHIGDRMIEKGDTTGPHSAKVVLSDPSVEVAVLETARGGITRRGLGYDWSDISIMTNIGPDHIGQDGIESVEDLVYIKSLVAERVREGGTLILNADDEHLSRLMEEKRVSRVQKRVVYFSLHSDNLQIEEHIAAGETAYFLQDNWIVEAKDNVRQPCANVFDIPVTMNGTAEFQIGNIMAAIAACRAYCLPIEQIASALRGFRSDADNPGRVNLYKVKNGNVLIDYGHNPDAFEAICRMAAKWDNRRVVGVIGVPGDRDDSLVEQAGRVAARGFHRAIIKEDQDLRGRQKGEVAGLLCKAVHDEVPGTECMTVLDEVEAFSKELEQMEDNQIIVVFYDKLDPVLNVLKQHDAVPVETLEKAEAQTSMATAGV